MSESVARTYIGYATEAMKEPGAHFSVAEKVLVYASLAQAHATLEWSNRGLRSGIRLGYAEELARAMEHLARKMPDR